MSSKTIKFSVHEVIFKGPFHLKGAQLNMNCMVWIILVAVFRTVSALFGGSGGAVTTTTSVVVEAMVRTVVTSTE